MLYRHNTVLLSSEIQYNAVELDHVLVEAEREKVPVAQPDEPTQGWGTGSQVIDDPPSDDETAVTNTDPAVFANDRNNPANNPPPSAYAMYGGDNQIGYKDHPPSSHQPLHV